MVDEATCGYSPTRHELDILEESADAVCSGRKTFEVRSEAKRRFEVGDMIDFRVIGRDDEPIPEHALNRRSYRVTYVLRGWGLKQGFAAIAIRPVRWAVLDLCAEGSLEDSAASALPERELMTVGEMVNGIDHARIHDMTTVDWPEVSIDVSEAIAKSLCQNAAKREIRATVHPISETPPRNVKRGFLQLGA